MKSTSLLSAALALLLVTSGCSYIPGFGGSSEKGSPTNSSRSSEGNGQQKREGMIVTWEVPSEAVDGFVIRYGIKQDQLDQELKIATAELKQEQDTQYGAVYRYTVPDVPRGTPLFAAIAAYKGERISDFSEVIPARDNVR